uniref:Terpene synthase 1 n=2 Tax=Copaifera TaxID=162716 RepID=U3MMQ7_9FABA|nr:terpene synthase 1 [Copaifera officinalis]AGW18159.1 terpene synthase 1 [Copaifera langsdorffii]
MGRPTANFSSSVWGNQFLSIASGPLLKNKEAEIHQHLQNLKEQVRKQLKNGVEEPSEKLNMIDTIQRLGVSYHFETEIVESLQQLHKNPPSSWDAEDVDAHLLSISLWFRLLRQQGYYVSCDVFNKFKDDKGVFKTALIDDVEGMLALYEAAYLGIRGEEILDQVLEFTVFHLKSRLEGMTPYLQERVDRALYCPINKGLPRIETRYFISTYSKKDSRNDLLLEFAMLDFNILQQQYQKELSHLTEWYKKLDFVSKVPYTRDRIVEGYFWPLGAYFENQYSKGRIIVSKLISVLTALDDTYDAYGTVDELKLFTEAIKRWDINMVASLPECMKVVFQAILDLLSEMELLTEEDGISSFVEYVKPALQDLAKSYLLEAEWRDKSYIPTYEEYMANGVFSCGYPAVETTSLLGLGKTATKEVFDWISNVPKIVRASSIMCRLTDDLASHKFEQNREHVGSAIECCMRQYEVSEEEAYKILLKEIENAWKDLNEEYMKPNGVPKVVLKCVLNFSRVIEFLYGHFVDKYTNAEMLKDQIASLFVDPIAIELNK